MVSHAQLCEFARFVDAQRKLPLAERIKMKGARRCLEVLALDENELQLLEQKREVYAGLLRMAGILCRVRRNVARAVAGEHVAPFHGCESRPAFSTLVYEIGNGMLLGLFDVLDKEKDEERRHREELLAFAGELEALARAFSRRRRGCSAGEMQLLLERLDQRRDGLIQAMFAPASACGAHTAALAFARTPAF